MAPKNKKQRIGKKLVRNINFSKPSTNVDFQVTGNEEEAPIINKPESSTVMERTPVQGESTNASTQVPVEYTYNIPKELLRGMDSTLRYRVRMDNQGRADVVTNDPDSQPEVKWRNYEDILGEQIQPNRTMFPLTGYYETELARTQNKLNQPTGKLFTKSTLTMTPEEKKQWLAIANQNGRNITEEQLNQVLATTPVTTYTGKVPTDDWLAKGNPAGGYNTATGDIGIDESRGGKNPSVPIHEGAHALDYKLGLSDGEAGEIDKTKLGVYNIKDVHEARGTNSQLRNQIRKNNSDKPLEKVIDGLTIDQMKSYVDQMNKGVGTYFKSSDINEKNLPGIKRALKEVAFNTNSNNPNFGNNPENTSREYVSYFA